MPRAGEPRARAAQCSQVLPLSAIGVGAHERHIPAAFDPELRLRTSRFEVS